ncbi:MAG: NHL domain/cytochrome c family protein, partial [Gammaproteobacteria bacterium]|nr:NHL domain/cytochrome c family protein [Gammaproteobacteria bacterium]
MCYSCHHGAVIDSRLSIGRGDQHPDIHHQMDIARQKEIDRQDEVSKQFPLIADKQLYCGSCHTPHSSDIDEADTLYESHANPWLRVLNEEGDLCQKCHESKLASTIDEKYPLSGINHPVGIFLKSPPTGEAQGYASTKKLQNGLPQELESAGGNLGSEQQMLCQSCHQIHGAAGKQLLLSNFDKNELCASCHENMYSEDKKEARHKGIHPVNIEMDEAVDLSGEKVKQVTCLACHSVHNGREDSALLTRATEQVEQLCASCHSRHHADDEKEAREKGVHVVNIELDEPVKLGEEEVSKVTCLSCHSVHAGKPDTPALRFKYKNGKLCSYCHEGNEAVVNTDHDLRLTAKSTLNKYEQSPEQAGACGSCHSMHRAEGKAPFLYSGEFTAYTGK